MDVDASAPVQAHAELVVGASPTEVWALLTDLDHWPDWNPDVQDVVADGPVAPGIVFRWRAGRAQIVSTIRETRKPFEMAWTGRTPGIRAVHVWRLQPERGGTLIWTAESWSGLLPRLLRGRLARKLQHALDKGMYYLDVEFGRRAAAQAAAESEAAQEAEGSATAA